MSQRSFPILSILSASAWFLLLTLIWHPFFFCWQGRLIHRRRLVHLAASRRRLVHLAASRRRAAPTVEPVGEHVYKTLFSYSIRSSRNPVRRLPFETDTVRNMQIFTYLLPYLFRIVHVIWTARWCVDGVSLYGPLRSEVEFWHHLPVILGIHNLSFGTCIWRTAGRCCRNSVSDRSGSWKLTASMHGWWHFLAQSLGMVNP